MVQRRLILKTGGIGLEPRQVWNCPAQGGAQAAARPAMTRRQLGQPFELARYPPHKPSRKGDNQHGPEPCGHFLHPSLFETASYREERPASLAELPGPRPLNTSAKSGCQGHRRLLKPRVEVVELRVHYPQFLLDRRTLRF